MTSGARAPSPDDYARAATLRRGLRTFLARSAQITRENGLTPERYQLLLAIKVSTRDEATVSRLAEQLSIGQSAATQLVRRAEDRGLLTRAVSRQDARIRLLRLTSEGEARLARTLRELRRDGDILRTTITEATTDLPTEVS